MAKCVGIVERSRFFRMGGETGRDFFVRCIANLLTPLRIRSSGPYCEGVGTHSSQISVLCTVRTALIYCAKDPLVFTRPVEISQVAKKQRTHGATGRNWMLARAQKILKTFHSEERAASVLGAHAFCWMKLIWSARVENKAENSINKILR